MSSFPPLMRELAATCRTEWTCVVPLGTTLTVSSTERMLCVTMRPSAEILKFWKVQARPSNRSYLEEEDRIKTGFLI